MLRSTLTRFQRLIQLDRLQSRRTQRKSRRRSISNCSPEQLERREVLSVTTSYSFIDIQNIDLPQGPTTSQPSATRLTNGGVAVSGTRLGSTYLDIFNNSLGDAGGANMLNGSNSDAAELSNLNLVVVTQDTDSIRYTIRNQGGASVTNSIDIGDVDSSEPAVAALTNGGFWIVNQDTNGGTNWNIEVRRYDNAGVLQGSFVVDATTALDAKPAIAQLGNGNVVVAWTRTIGVQTEIWRAIYSSTGTTVAAPALVDTNGSTNRNVDVARISGGFALVYEDSEWDTQTRDITMKRFTSSGALIGTTNLSNPDGLNDFGHEANPVIARLENGLLVVGWEDNRMSTNTDTFVYLVDPTTGLRLGTQGRNVSAGEAESDDVSEIAIAGTSRGRIVVFHRNLTDNDVDGESFAVRRTSTSDASGDTITGDLFIDNIQANGGNDTLLGGGGNDILNAGTGQDILNGEAGQDVMAGGGQSDQFVFTSILHSPNAATRDTITDFTNFTPGHLDKINVAAIDGKLSTAGVNAFTEFIGSDEFSAEGQIRAVQSGLDTIVQFNNSFAGGVDMEILLQNYTATNLSLSDFIVAASAALTSTGSRAASSSPKTDVSSRNARGSEVPEQSTASRVALPKSSSAIAAPAASKSKKSGQQSSGSSVSLKSPNRMPFDSTSPLEELDAVFSDVSSRF